MLLIGINGLKRSGKNEVANIIAAEADANGEVVVQRAFADKLKELGSRTLGFEHNHIGTMDTAKEDWGIDVITLAEEGPTKDFVITKITCRQYLQNIGAEARDIFGTNFWIDQVLPNPSIGSSTSLEVDPLDRLRRQYGPIEPDYVLITDVRYENEAERIHALGGIVWEVIRPGLESDGHSSEQPLPMTLIDQQIINDGSLEDLRDSVVEALNLALVAA